MSRSLLIVDDDARIRTSLLSAIGSEADDIETAENAETALKKLENRTFDVILSDVRMPGMDGLDLLAILGRDYPESAVILMTAYDDLPTISAAMREGAVDFLVKPLELTKLREVIRRVFKDRGEENYSRIPDRHRNEKARKYDLIGHDPGMIEIFKLIGRVSAGRTNVVIRGESGTGKELVARAIHASSPYSSEPFVAVNCTALPSSLLESELFGHVKGSFTGAARDHRGRFALAGTGTVFLDEIGDTSVEFQAKLLRVLQEHEYFPVGAEQSQPMKARVIAATHRNLERLIEAGDFREDLYYRLRVVEIKVPPLRERPGDIPLLAHHLIQKVASEAGLQSAGISDDAHAALQGHTWPGNVRELENTLARALVLAAGSVIRPEHLDIVSRENTGGSLVSMEMMEREHLKRVLKATGGHKVNAAKILEISRPRLDRLIEKHGLVHLIPDR